MDAAQEKSRYTIEILDVSLDVIDLLLSAKDGYMSSSEVANALQLNRSRAYRILKTLEQRNYVSSSATQDGYRLGSKFLQIGEQIRNHRDIRLIARPVLEALAEKTGETANLSIRYGDEVMLVDHQRGTNRIQIADPIGALYPLHAGAGSKVMLAFLPELEREQLLHSLTLKRCTPNTITDKDALRTVLDQVITQGYGVDAEEQELGIWGVGAPVFDSTNRVIASISVFVPVVQYDEDGKAMLIRAVVDAGRQVSTLLGWRD